MARGAASAQRAAARAHASARGVGGDGAAGRARNQEPADAHPAVRRASAARARRSRASRSSPVARELRRHDPDAGAAAPADRRRVLELCLLADRTAGASLRSPSSSTRSSSRTARGWPGASTSTCEVDAGSAAGRSSIACWSGARSPTSSRTRCTRCRAAARCVIAVASAARRAIALSLDDHGHGRRDGRGGARADLRAVFLDEGDRHGLGLTIAKRNMELNGGTIAIESERARHDGDVHAAGLSGSDRRARALSRSGDPLARRHELISSVERSLRALIVEHAVGSRRLAMPPRSGAMTPCRRTPRARYAYDITSSTSSRIAWRSTREHEREQDQVAVGAPRPQIERLEAADTGSCSPSGTPARAPSRAPQAA